MSGSNHPSGRSAATAAARPRAGLLSILGLVAALSPLAAHPGLAQEPGARVEAPEQREVIERVIAVLAERYIFPELAARMADSLVRDLEAGVHSRAAEPAAFADALSGRLRGLSGDGHLWVMHQPEPAGGAREEPDPEAAAARRRRLARSNFGFPRAEILAGNVGYLDIRQFVNPELGGETAAASMAFLANVDALILDVRESMGGSPRMVELLASYLFGAQPVHLFDIYLRPEDRTDQYWTQPFVPSRRLIDQPVYVLTRASTFSAGEGLAYILKHVGRATVVGERTAGGAHPGDVHRLTERFAMFVATGRVISPATGGNWEGTGVAPDVEAAPPLALGRAHRLALERLLEREGDAARAAELRALIADIRDRPQR